MFQTTNQYIYIYNWGAEQKRMAIALQKDGDENYKRMGAPVMFVGL